MTPLRQRMIEDMKLRNFSPHTVRAYVDRVAAFAKHYGKSPQVLGRDEVRAYLLFLIEEKRVSWAYYGQAICALRFLYRVTLGNDWVIEGVVSPRKETRLPVVLSPAEVSQFFEAVDGLKHRAILMTAYAAGLRVSGSRRFCAHGGACRAFLKSALALRVSGDRNAGGASLWRTCFGDWHRLHQLSVSSHRLTCPG
jgi:hypothetical protein